MRVFKVKKGIEQYIKVTENNFIEATKRQYPYYQTVNDEKKQYAYCPACENPVLLIHLHVDDQFMDENKRKVSMHARHIKKSVKDLGDFDQAAYDSCPYANPNSSTSKARRTPGKTSNEILELLKNYPDAIDTIIRQSVGIKATEQLFSLMVKNFKEEQGHLFRYVTKNNLPYAFAYMADSQNLFYASFDSNYESGRNLIKDFNERAKWCVAYKYGRIDRKKAIKNQKRYVDLTFHFTSFDTFEIDEERYQRFYFVIMEKLGEEEHEVLRQEVIFNQYYFLNTVAKRQKYQRLVKGEYT